MRVLMLGWEFPPYISGGLGTACFGLTRALSRHQTEVVFVLPRAAMVDAEAGAPVRVMSTASSVGSAAMGDGLRKGRLDLISLRPVPSRMVSPYQSAGGAFHGPHASAPEAQTTASRDKPIGVLGLGRAPAPSSSHDPAQHYAGDLIGETRRYAELCLALARDDEFDVIHAHDWMTFPAGIAIAAATGKPLVVHVHSTEFDRAGDNINQQVYEIERRGMHGACRVIAVSHLTRSILQHRYGVGAERIDVIYNGIENGRPAAGYDPRYNIRQGEKIVLFLGRMTMQKGPEYFVAAARKVLEKFDKVKFVMAGTGDKVRDIIELAAREGIGHKVLFTGFLHGHDVERVFKMADVYVMPSVSEPFGIAPLEAISHNVPVIISKTSGVAEVLTHALKVDFWDTHEIANKILAVLRHPPLSNTLRESADMEVRRLTWDGAASQCLRTYARARAMVGV